MAVYQTLILLNLRKWDNPNKPGTGYSLDVVQSVTDGQSKGVGVEFVYYKDDGAKRIGKPIQGKDLNRIWEMRVQIKELMDNPPPIPEPVAAAPIEAGGDLAAGGGFGETAGLDGGSLEQCDLI